jgi:hypothetical protein
VSACGGDDPAPDGEATSDVAAPVIPEVLCTDTRYGEVVFAYTNENETAVVVDPASSVVTGAIGSTASTVPVVFAPGRLSPAFWVTPSDPSGAVLPSWTVVGPDGESRTAGADDTTPSCDDELLTSTTDDQRQPSLEFGDPTLSADDGAVEVTVEVIGVPVDSVCPAGLDPEPVSVTIDDGNGGRAVDAASAEWSIPLGPPSDGGERSGLDFVAAMVLDRCGTDGVVQQIWPGGSFESIYDGVLVCVSETDGVPRIAVEGDEGCTRLPGTGGSRTRPG